MRSDVFVYISGPMTAKNGRSMELHTAEGVDLYLECLKAGIPAFSPHLSGAFPSAWSAMSHADWIVYDKAVIDRCTHMLMMERWRGSTGAVMEYEYAIEKKIPIMFSLDELIRSLVR